MTNPIARLTEVEEQGHHYQAIMLVCPACHDLHMLPVGGDVNGKPQWDFDGNLEAPTLSPSVLTRYNSSVCHSFVRAGRWEFLGDCTHEFAGQTLDCVPLEDWQALKR